jgi:hypothetical protein
VRRCFVERGPAPVRPPRKRRRSAAVQELRHSGGQSVIGPDPRETTHPWMMAADSRRPLRLRGGEREFAAIFSLGHLRWVDYGREFDFQVEMDLFLIHLEDAGLLGLVAFGLDLDQVATAFGFLEVP